MSQVKLVSVLSYQIKWTNYCTYFFLKIKIRFDIQLSCGTLGRIFFEKRTKVTLLASFFATYWLYVLVHSFSVNQIVWYVLINYLRFLQCMYLLLLSQYEINVSCLWWQGDISIQKTVKKLLPLCSGFLLELLQIQQEVVTCINRVQQIHLLSKMCRQPPQTISIPWYISW